MSRRLATALVAGPLVAAIVAVGLGAAWLHGAHLPLISGRRWFTVTKVGETHFADEPTQPFFFLVVGNDGRPGVGGARGDALHLIGVNPAAHAATILDIPRDTGVSIPGHGVDKINAAFAYGGLALEAEVVGRLVGVSVPYAVTTNFDGFTAMIDEIGGLDVDVPVAMHDSDSGAYFQPGLQHLDGDQALRFSRDRHDFPRGDIERTGNQGYLIVSALGDLRRSHGDAAGTITALAALARHTELQDLGLTDLYRFGRLALAIDPGNVKNVTIPVTSGPGTNLDLGPGAASLFADFADDGVLESH